MMSVNGAIQSPDPQFQSSKLIDNGLQRLFHRRRKSFAITLVRDDLSKLRDTFASRLRNEAELRKVGSKPGKQESCQKIRSFLRRSCRVMTTLPALSTPCTWNTFLARLAPMVLICI